MKGPRLPRLPRRTRERANALKARERLAALTEAGEEGRAVALRMSQVQLAAFDQLAADYGPRLARRVAVAYERRGEAAALREARTVLGALTRDMAQSTRNAVVLTARRVSDAHAALGGSLTTSDPAAASQRAAEAAQAVLERPELARSFRRLRAESAGAVERALQRATARGATAAQVERELRLLLGPETEVNAPTLRKLGYGKDDVTPDALAAVRKDAGRLAKTGRLIARTEPLIAEHEAHTRALKADPAVLGVRWRTSASHRHVDVCDQLAEGDFYRLGAGVYPVEKVPARPHPRCSCEALPVLRPVEEWGTPRTVPKARRTKAAAVLGGGR